jgi:hypothetical protein
VLDVLDKELEKRGHKFVRYADDFSIYCRSKRAAERVMKSIKEFVETVLHLQINAQKSEIRHPVKYAAFRIWFLPKIQGSLGITNLSKICKAFEADNQATNKTQ